MVKKWWCEDLITMKKIKLERKLFLPRYLHRHIMDKRKHA